MVRCKIDNYEWRVSPLKLLDGKGCPKCKSSHGEKKVDYILSLFNIMFIKQKKYNNLRGLGGRLLKYDFALTKNKKIIGLVEYNGQQHYFPVRFNNRTTKEQAENNFKIQQVHDNFKIEYSMKNKIPLLIMPYWQFNNIETLLIKFLDDINYFETNNNCVSFNFEENKMYLNLLNTFQIDELRSMYHDNKTRIGNLIKYNGEIHNIKDWAEKLNIKKGTLWYRISQGKSLEDAFNQNINQYNKNIIEYNGIEYTQRELSNYLQIPETYLCANLKKSMDIDSILNKYKNKKHPYKQYQIEYNGKIYTKKDLSKLLNIPWTSLSRYIDRGEDIYEIAKRYSKNVLTS